MNKDYVLYNLTEAHEALGGLTANMKSDREYDYSNNIAACHSRFVIRLS